MAKQQTTLVSPDGKRTWTPEDATQATNLRAQGWKPKEEPKKTAAPKSDK
jgi:hypothetical protein